MGVVVTELVMTDSSACGYGESVVGSHRKPYKSHRLRPPVVLFLYYTGNVVSPEAPLIVVAVSRRTLSIADRINLAPGSPSP